MPFYNAFVIRVLRLQHATCPFRHSKARFSVPLLFGFTMFCRFAVKLKCTVNKFLPQKNGRVLPFYNGWLFGFYVCSTQLAVFGVCYHIERNCLPVLQSFETFRLNCREVHKHVFATVFSGNKSVTLACVKPFYSSFHFWCLQSYL